MLEQPPLQHAPIHEQMHQIPNDWSVHSAIASSNSIVTWMNTNAFVPQWENTKLDTIREALLEAEGGTVTNIDANLVMIVIVQHSINANWLHLG